MTVEEYLEDCIYYQETSLAHYIHHLLVEKKISLRDDASKIDLNQADHQKVAEMILGNVLGFHKKYIYSLKMCQGTFVFIFAGSQEEAIQFYRKTYHQSPLNCHEYLLDFEVIRGNEVISFRNMMKEFESIPAIAGCYMKGR